MGQTSDFDPNLLISHKFPEVAHSYSERDVILYALGVGACARDAVDENELKYVYHEDGQQFIQVLPTFAAVFAVASFDFQLPGLEYDPRLLLHGQQYIEIHKSFPSSGCIQNKASISGLHDKGKAAIVEIEIESYEKESGELLCKNRMTTYLRGAGGFSKSSEPYSYSKYPNQPVSAVKVPKSQPFVVFGDCTQPSQALLYRLSGDYSPLHSDPGFAKIAGCEDLVTNRRQYCFVSSAIFEGTDLERHVFYASTKLSCGTVGIYLVQIDSLAPYCMGCAHWGLQLGRSSDVSAEETQTW